MTEKEFIDKMIKLGWSNDIAMESWHYLASEIYPIIPIEDREKAARAFIAGHGETSFD